MDVNSIITILSNLKHRVFPRPFERLAVSGSNLVGVEIGVYKGEHAESLLLNLDIEKLYLVDPYMLYDEYFEGKSHYGIDQEPLEVAKQQAIKRLGCCFDKITWIEKKSDEAIGDLPDDLDFVYIDGNHDEEFVKHDIKLYFKKLKRGGVIGGHDFYNGYCREHDGVIRAVTQFSTQYNLTLQVELPDWWIKK